MIYEYSCIGGRHAACSGENEDAVCTRQNTRYTAISLADGVSACRKARAGAETASTALADLLAEKGTCLFDFSCQQIVEVTISHILHKLQLQVGQELDTVEDYSSTMAGALFDRQRQRMLYFNLGDGMILAQVNGRSQILSMPSDSSSGCCVTTTRNACRIAEAKVIEADQLESVLLCSDGAWRQMFDRNRMKPEVSSLLVRHDWKGLETYLCEQNCSDDYSFVALDLA